MFSLLPVTGGTLRLNELHMALCYPTFLHFFLLQRVSFRFLRKETLGEVVLVYNIKKYLQSIKMVFRGLNKHEQI